MAGTLETQGFQWNLNVSSTTLSSCQPLGITIKTIANAQSVPPFYMLAYEIDGRPTRTALGNDNLVWRVDHPAGSRLMVNVVDSKGNTGGIPPSLYTISDGDTSCLPQSSSSDFILTTNVTGSLNTCEPWGLQAQGGTPPYSFTLAALDSNSVTNATLKESDNTYTYINRANPNSQFLAVASDSSGQWAKGSVLIKTQGSTDTTCGNLESTSSNSPPFQQSQSSSLSSAATTSPSTTSGSSSKSNTPIIAGVCAGVGSLIVLGVILVLFIRQKRRREAAVIISQPFINTNESPPPQREKPAPSLVPTSSTSVHHHNANSSQSTRTITSQESVTNYTESSYVVQHRDADDAIRLRELPPPYANRSRG